MCAPEPRGGSSSAPRRPTAASTVRLRLPGLRRRLPRAVLGAAVRSRRGDTRPGPRVQQRSPEQQQAHRGRCVTAGMHNDDLLAHRAMRPATTTTSPFMASRAKRIGSAVLATCSLRRQKVTPRCLALRFPLISAVRMGGRNVSVRGLRRLLCAGVARRAGRGGGLPRSPTLLRYRMMTR
jgi:hypothetical protein